MRITNKLNLPEPIVRAVVSESYDKEPDMLRYSVTELLASVKQILLGRYHWSDLEEDVADRMPALIGTAIHKLLESTAPEGSRTEVKLEAKIDEFTLVGIIDVLLDNEIQDYKSCSVNKVIRKDFEDWRKQGLAYALLNYIVNHVIVRKLKFYAIMKDWSKIKAATNSNYPQAPVYVWEYDISDSDYDYINDFIRKKLRAIYTAHQLKQLPNCTDEERWYTGTEYAVYKNVSDKKASYVTRDEQDAHNYITNKCGGAAEIKVRKGEYLCCEHYCSCKKFCERS